MGFICIQNILIQWGTNPGPQISMANKLCTVAPSICESPIWNLLHVTLLTLRILRHLVDFFFLCVHPCLNANTVILKHQISLYVMYFHRWICIRMAFLEHKLSSLTL